MMENDEEKRVSIEIGSEFWDIILSEKENEIFPQNCCWYSSGRAAEIAVIRAIKERHTVKKVMLPDWNCESMVMPFLREGISVEFYSWTDRQINTDADILFIMDFFGYRRPIYAEGFEGVIIRDLTQSVFCGPYHDADYYFGSLRKWMGFAGGGFAWGDGLSEPAEGAEEYFTLRKKAMNQKKQYIFGLEQKKEYLGFFAEAEDLLDRYRLQAGNDGERYAARHIDVETVRKKRRCNAQLLLNEFGERAVFRSLEEADCPLFVPLCVDRRDELQKKLIENQVYCPIHWRGRDLDGQEISLVCDQRYSGEDMNRMIGVIKDFYDECNSN